jgi:hypothetical protein
VTRTRAADDFATIRARMEKLPASTRREHDERDRGKVNRVGQLAPPVEQRATGSWSAARAGGQTPPLRSKRSEPARRD